MCALGCSCHLWNVSVLAYFTHVPILLTIFAECRLAQVLFAIAGTSTSTRNKTQSIDSCKCWALRKWWHNFSAGIFWARGVVVHIFLLFLHEEEVTEEIICNKTRLWWRMRSDVKRKTRLKQATKNAAFSIYHFSSSAPCPLLSSLACPGCSVSLGRAAIAVGNRFARGTIWEIVVDAHLIEGRTREVALKVGPGQNSTNGKWFEIQTDAKYVVILRNFPLSIINNCNETLGARKSHLKTLSWRHCLEIC